MPKKNLQLFILVVVLFSFEKLHASGFPDLLRAKACLSSLKQVPLPQAKQKLYFGPHHIPIASTRKFIFPQQIRQLLFKTFGQVLPETHPLNQTSVVWIPRKAAKNLDELVNRVGAKALLGEPTKIVDDLPQGANVEQGLAYATTADFVAIPLWYFTLRGISLTEHLPMDYLLKELARNLEAAQNAGIVLGRPLRAEDIPRLPFAEKTRKRLAAFIARGLTVSFEMGVDTTTRIHLDEENLVEHIKEHFDRLGILHTNNRQIEINFLRSFAESDRTLSLMLKQMEETLNHELAHESFLRAEVDWHALQKAWEEHVQFEVNAYAEGRDQSGFFKRDLELAAVFPVNILEANANIYGTEHGVDYVLDLLHMLNADVYSVDFCAAKKPELLALLESSHFQEGMGVHQAKTDIANILRARDMETLLVVSLTYYVRLAFDEMYADQSSLGQAHDDAYYMENYRIPPEILKLVREHVLPNFEKFFRHPELIQDFLNI